MAASELFKFTSSEGGALEFKKSKAAKQKVKAAKVLSDTEQALQDGQSSANSGSSETLDGAGREETLQEISGSDSVFTWENIEYTVPYMGGERKLLNKITGYAKPGVSKSLDIPVTLNARS